MMIIRSASRLLVMSALAATLSACASKGGGDGVSETERKITTALLFPGQTLPDPPKVADREVTCPAVQVLDGTASYRVGDSASARGVSHQSSINDYARECRLDGNTYRVKVGIQGRVVLGDAGKAGTITVPVRVAVRKDGQIVYSRLLATPVAIPAGDTQAPFVVIDENIALPVTAEDPGEEYKVLIGIDPKGQPAPRKKRR